MISSLSRAYERTEEMQKRGIFANLFLLQNRLQALSAQKKEAAPHA